MAKEIINRVANSKLVTIDLEDYFPSNPRSEIDIKDWLFEGLVLREKEFRAYVNDHNWEQYDTHFVAINCSSEAIVPLWAYMLIQLKLSGRAKQVIYGSMNELNSLMFYQIIENLDLNYCQDKPVIIKGCSNVPVPENAYLFLVNKLKTIAKSILFGEACSSVPLHKN